MYCICSICKLNENTGGLDDAFSLFPSVDSRSLPPPPRPRPISVLVAVPLPRQRAVPAAVIAAAVAAPGTPVAAVTATKAVGSPEQQTSYTNKNLKKLLKSSQ